MVENSTIFGPRTVQKRLRDGYRNDWETLEPAASTPSSGDERSWEVSFASGQASRRVTPPYTEFPDCQWCENEIKKSVSQSVYRCFPM
jgi:hypothetical protein